MPWYFFKAYKTNELDYIRVVPYFRNNMAKKTQV